MKKRGSIFDNKQRKGQFFLIAAVVIIVVVISVVTISNYVQKKDIERTWKIAQEMGIEGKNVLDWGTYNELNEEQMKVLMEKFAKNFVNYIEEKKNVYFVFGNSRNVSVIGYQEIVNESVCVNVTGNACAPYLKIGERQEFSVGEGVTLVEMIISSIKYDFELGPGENFYFVIWQIEGGEKIVVTSEDR